MESGESPGRWRLARHGVSRVVDLGGVRLHEIEYSPRATFPKHCHESSTITLVLRGSFEEDAEGRTGLAGVCSVLVKPAGAAHANRFDARGVRTLVLEVDDARPETWPAFFRGDGQAMILSDLRAARAMLECFRRVSNGGCDDAVETLRPLLRGLGCPNENAGASSPECAAELAREALQREPESDGTFGDMAERLGVHRVTLSRVYHERFGCTMSQHRRRLRVLDAAARIASSEAPLARIAALAGFADQSHMTRAFGRELGVSPGAFRRVSRPG